MSYASLQKTEEWDHEKFRKDFCMECYSPPLRVRLDVALVSSSTNVAPDEKTFLESTFQITDNNSIRFWLKNNSDEQQHWNYSHFLSHASLTQRKANSVS